MIIRAMIMGLLLLALISQAGAQDADQAGAQDACVTDSARVVLGSADFDHERFVRHLSGTETCLACHGDYNPIERRANDSRHSLWINGDLFMQSVHAKNGCHSCHTNIDAYGHRVAGSGAETASGCSPCHTESNLVEGEAVPDMGDSQSAVDTTSDDLPADIAEMIAGGDEMVLTVALRSCIDCHEDEYLEYSDSVHGQSILTHEDSDSPYCIDCHGIHYILPAEDARAKTHPTNVHTTCLSCHDQEDIKARAGLNRSVGESFSDSFHGKRSQVGGADVAVCSTCHGNHAIFAEDDPRSKVNQRNIARMCGECHEGAQLNFATAFTHKSVSPTEQKGLYILKQIYKWVIFLLIAQFVLFAALDTVHNYLRKRAKAKQIKDSDHA